MKDRCCGSRRLLKSSASARRVQGCFLWPLIRSDSVKPALRETCTMRQETSCTRRALQINYLTANWPNRVFFYILWKTLAGFPPWFRSFPGTDRLCEGIIDRELNDKVMWYWWKVLERGRDSNARRRRSKRSSRELACCLMNVYKWIKFESDDKI